MTSTPKNLYDLDRQALEALVCECGEKPYRAKQLYRQLYANAATSFEEMTDLSGTLRDGLAAASTIGSLKLVTVHTGDKGMTRKALFELKPGVHIETVLMVYPDRATACVSSQAGCPMGCVFCATAKLGFLYDLTPGQMIEQVLWASREVQAMSLPAEHPGNLTNVVFMGMGEPFNNYDNWWEAVTRLHDPDGFNMGARRFTVSTVGLIPGINRLADEELQINLAISLHAPDDQLRGEMMPVNKRYPIAELLEATRSYLDKTGRRVSFEYVLMQQKNDEPEQAKQLADILSNGPLADQRQLFHVNLIPWNPVFGSPLTRSHRQRVLDFQRVLRERNVPCTVRVERGVDIGAACGQLAGSPV